MGAIVPEGAMMPEDDTQSAAGTDVGAATIGGRVGATALMRGTESAAGAMDEVELVTVATAAGMGDAESTAGTKDDVYAFAIDIIVEPCESANELS